MVRPKTKAVRASTPRASNQEIPEIYSRSPSSPYSSSVEESPLRPIFCIKKNVDVKRYEEIDDCFILDFDPYDSMAIAKLSVAKNISFTGDDDPNDISVVAEKGKVACRDYPHSRHLCVKYPFNSTNHEICCELCYCYVCDSRAPCENWTRPQTAHCHAAENVGKWKQLRKSTRKQQSQTC